MRRGIRYAVDARLAHYQQAGITTYTTNLLQSMRSQLGADESVVVLQSRKQTVPLVPGFAIQSVLTPPHHRLEQLGLAVELAGRGYSVGHFPDFVPAFHVSFPTIVTIHDLAFLEFPHLLTAESKRYYGQVGLAVARSRIVVTVSESTKRDVMRRLGVKEDKIRVVYEAASSRYAPLDRSHVADGLRERFSLDPGYFLFVGTIEPRKNLSWLLRVFDEVRRARASRGLSCPRLAVAGRRGWLCEEVFRLAESLGMGDQARFLGGVSAEDLLLLYNGARALVFPSLYEGFGLPLIEAMACGAPVLATNVSSIPEVVGDAGILVSPSDDAGLAAALDRLADDDALHASLRSQGFGRAAQFSWNRAAKETLEIYREAAGRC